MRNSGSLEMAEFHAKGITSPEKDPPRVLSARRSAEKNRKKFPRKAICKLMKGKWLVKQMVEKHKSGDIDQMSRRSNRYYIIYIIHLF